MREDLEIVVKFSDESRVTIVGQVVFVDFDVRQCMDHDEAEVSRLRDARAVHE